jgi:hypothetical protein
MWKGMFRITYFHCPQARCPESSLGKGNYKYLYNLQRLPDESTRIKEANCKNHVTESYTTLVRTISSLVHIICCAATVYKPQRLITRLIKVRCFILCSPKLHNLYLLVYEQF